MHQVLERQMKRESLCAEAPPADQPRWASFLQAVSRAYEHADDDRSVLERSLMLTSEEMGELHAQLAAERDTLSRVIHSLNDGVVATDASGTILFINSEARRLLNLPPDEDLRGHVLHERASARTGDGRSLNDLLRRVEPADHSNPDRDRLIVGEDHAKCICFVVTRLGKDTTGAVLRLTDVTERTQLESERAELNRRLLEISREAGMAEVATSVLHNVGNVLNSVNVSASVLAERLKESEVASLVKAGHLIREHRSDLPAFLSTDERGRHLADFLIELAQCLGAEQTAMLAEVESVMRGVEHVRHVVSVQQAHAKRPSMVEPVILSELMDAAVELQRDALARHEVVVERRYEQVEPVCIDKHQVLQVLLNVIRNAKQAMAQVPRNERRLTLTVARRAGAGGEHVVFEVADNGVGIAPENLTRIFSHGFTTRRDGHGFGLHSAANAARAMGGSLGVFSDGLGKGARFVLSLPPVQGRGDPHADDRAQAAAPSAGGR